MPKKIEETPRLEVPKKTEEEKIRADEDTLKQKEAEAEAYKQKIIELFEKILDENKDQLSAVLNVGVYKRNDYKKINEQLLKEFSLDESAIKVLQEYLGINADGKVGPDTINAISDKYNLDIKVKRIQEKQSEGEASPAMEESQGETGREGREVERRDIIREEPTHGLPDKIVDENGKEWTFVRMGDVREEVELKPEIPKIQIKPISELPSENVRNIDERLRFLAGDYKGIEWQKYAPLVSTVRRGTEEFHRDCIWIGEPSRQVFPFDRLNENGEICTSKEYYLFLRELVASPEDINAIVTNSFIPYDPYNDECAREPLRTFEKWGGDCDDKAAIAVDMLNYLGNKKGLDYNAKIISCGTDLSKVERGPDGRAVVPPGHAVCIYEIDGQKYVLDQGRHSQISDTMQASDEFKRKNPIFCEIIIDENGNSLKFTIDPITLQKDYRAVYLNVTQENFNKDNFNLDRLLPDDWKKYKRVHIAFGRILNEEEVTMVLQQDGSSTIFYKSGEVEQEHYKDSVLLRRYYRDGDLREEYFQNGNVSMRIFRDGRMESVGG